VIAPLIEPTRGDVGVDRLRGSMAPMRVTGHCRAIGVLALLAFAACVPRAQANVAAPATRTNAVRDAATGIANGALTTTVTYTGAHATAVASTGDSIGLPPGSSLLLRSCVAYHLHGSAPLSSCAQRIVDTTSNDATVYTYAPPVTLARQRRPKSEPWAYFTAYVELQSLRGGVWLTSAHSWPEDGLQGAGIAVAARGEDNATLPPNSTVALDGAFNSAVNSGQPDSICTAVPLASDGSPLPAGVRSSHRAFSGAPGYYEVGLPTGDYAGQAPRGVMLVVHSGGWALAGVGGVQRVRPDADRWRARGWETVSFANRMCAQSFGDALWFHDRARGWFGPRTKICALGTSAGGNLALLIGAYRPDLYCAVSEAGPTDLRTIQDEVAYDAASGLFDQTLGGRWVHNLAAAAFGEENLSEYSPAAQAAGTLKGTRVLQGFSADDPTVPYQQAADLADAMRAANPDAYVDSDQLATGAIAFAHGHVTQAALDDFYAREQRLVAPVQQPTVALNKR
jgi:acetyl esterase/lipase